jgi:hypothetical protein
LRLKTLHETLPTELADLTQGSADPFNPGIVLLQDAAHQPVKASPVAEGDSLVWHLPHGAYYIVPQPVFGYVTPTLCDEVQPGTTAVNHACTEPITVAANKDTVVQVNYVHDDAALNIARLQGVVRAYWSAAQPLLKQWEKQRPPIPYEFDRALSLAADFVRSIPQVRASATSTDSPTPCTASLCFRLSEAPSSGEARGCQADYPGVPDVNVTLTAIDAAVPFCDTRRTGANGDVCFADLPAGAYRLAVERPPGYTLYDAYSVTSGSANIQSRAGDTIAIADGADVSVCASLIASKGAVTVHAVFDDDRCGQTAQHALIGGVQVDLYRGDTHLGCVHTLDTPSSAPANTLEVTQGMVALVARPTIEVGGRQLRAASFAPVLIRVGPDEKRHVYLRYEPGLGGISLSARLVAGSPDKTDVYPLPGVKLALFRGPQAVGEPMRTLMTRGDAETVFPDLPEGDYTIVPTGPAMFEGRPIGLTQPKAGLIHPNIRSGEVLPLGAQFTFAPVLARIVVSTVDAETNTALEGVGFVLSRAASIHNGQVSKPRAATSNPAGEAVFPDVPPGDWVVALTQDPATLADGSQWTPDPESVRNIGVPLHVESGTARLELRMIRDIHRISGNVVTPDGEAVPHAVIQIQNERGHVLDAVTADGTGNFEWIADIPGTYHLVVLDTHGGSTLQRFPATVGRQTQVTLTSPGVLRKNFVGAPATDGTNGTASSADGGTTSAQFAESAIDLTAYPILTEEVSFPMNARPAVGPTSGTSGGSLSQLAESAVRDVLNWRPKPNDPAGFSAALAQAFTLTDVEGHTQWKWTPRSYTVQTDLGAVTGAQASLYTRAKLALDQSLPLLDGLRPLNMDVPSEDLDSMRVVVRSSLVQLVNEFGLLGGPRVERVNELLTLLLGPRPYPRNPEDVQGQLKILKQRFGLERFRINTVEDEQDYTNFLVLADNIISLSQTWIGQQSFFDGTAPEPYMGTQLVLLSRDLEVVCELVQAAYFAMDSVFLGPAQRQTIQLQLSDTRSMPLADLMDWVYRVASEEGPRLFQNAGKDGITAFQSIIADLADLVSRAMLKGLNGGRQVISGTIPAAYSSPRVQRAFQALSKQLAETREDASKILPPTIGDAEFANVPGPQLVQNIADQVVQRINTGLALRGIQL